MTKSEFIDLYNGKRKGAIILSVIALVFFIVGIILVYKYNIRYYVQQRWLTHPDGYYEGYLYALENFDNTRMIYYSSIVLTVISPILLVIINVVNYFIYVINSNKEYELKYDMGKHIVLLLLTFGVWHLLWIFRVTRALNTKSKSNRNETKEVILCAFVPFYHIFWSYKTALIIEDLFEKKGSKIQISTLVLLLSIFVPIASPIIIQSRLNDYSESNEINKHFNEINSLKEFKSLLDMGAITQEEYDLKKKELLGL